MGRGNCVRRPHRPRSARAAAAGRCAGVQRHARDPGGAAGRAAARREPARASPSTCTSASTRAAGGPSRGRPSASRVGDRIRFGNEGRVCLLGKLDATVAAIGEAGEVELSFSLHGAYLDEAIEALGDPPLPPYIAGKRDRRARGCRALPDRLRAPRGRRRRADGGPAFHAAAAGGARRARHLPPLRHAARRRRHLPARQGRGHGRAPHARRVGRGLRRDGRRAQRRARRRRPHRRRRHHGAAAAGDRRRARTAPSAPSPARPSSSSRRATASRPSIC